MWFVQTAREATSLAAVRLMGTKMDTVTIRQQSASTDEQEQMQLGSRKLEKQKKML